MDEEAYRKAMEPVLAERERIKELLGLKPAGYEPDLSQCVKALKEINATLKATHEELGDALRDYMKAVDAYYRETPSAETVADKCVDLVLAEEKARAAIDKARLAGEPK